MIVVAKIGSSSLSVDGRINHDAITKLAKEVADLRREGIDVVVVTSGAIAVGIETVAPGVGAGTATNTPSPDVLRAASAVGQISLIGRYQDAFAAYGLPIGQVLLAPTDFWIRSRYLKSRGTIGALLAAGVVPIINENDAIADEEIRFGDNDRLAALVAHLIRADLMVLLTDTAGLFTADPRVDDSASLIEEIAEFDHRLEEVAGESRSGVGRGGMASKLAAAKIAVWSGVETVIAQAERSGVLQDAVADIAVGTVFRARGQRLAARKLWIAFASPAKGRVHVDVGARRALEQHQKSLLAAGVTACEGEFSPDDPVEIVDDQGHVFAKGLASWSSEELRTQAGLRSSELPSHISPEVIHRDDLVVLP